MLPKRPCLIFLPPMTERQEVRESFKALLIRIALGSRLRTVRPMLHKLPPARRRTEARRLSALSGEQALQNRLRGDSCLLEVCCFGALKGPAESLGSSEAEREQAGPGAGPRPGRSRTARPWASMDILGQESRDVAGWGLTGVGFRC